MRLALPTLLLAAPAAFAEQKPAAPATQAPAVPVARVTLVGKGIERSEAGREWEKAEAEFRLKTGDRIRTDAASVARVEFPWMAVTIGPSSTLWIPAGVVLSTVLEQGRAELRTDGAEIIKLRTAEVQVRGRGRVVVRRGKDATLVSALDGTFRLEAGSNTVALEKGHGAVVRPQRAPELVTLAEAPGSLSPATDPVYVRQGKTVALSWASPGAAHHVQVLAVGSEEILIDQDVAGAPQSIEIPWLGTFRWRVSQRDGQGLEGMPSAEGYVCVVEK